MTFSCRAYKAWHRQVIDGRRRFRHQGLATGGAQVPCRGVHQLTMRIQNILQIWGKCRWRAARRMQIARLVILSATILSFAVYVFLYRKQGLHTLNKVLIAQSTERKINTTAVKERATTGSVITLTGTTKKPVVCQEYNLTFVSAFFDFGDHPKGGSWRYVQTYYPWSEAFGRIYAPLIFYTDSDKFGEHIRQLRAHMAPHLTHVISVNRSTLWPFQYKDIIARLYARTDYPKHAPNTVVPEYSCSMHAKYACLHDAMVLQHGLVTTHFVAWVDIGYYRNLRDLNISYCIVPPKDFDETKVLYNQVYMPNFNLSARDIFYGNHVWVGGGMFIATREVMLRLCDEYKRAATFFLLKRNLSSTDQQTLYASMTTEGKRDVKLAVDIAVFSGEKGAWFKLGNSLLREV